MEQFKAALIWWIVLPIRLLTVFTDSGLILADDDKLLTNIWNTTVTSDPPPPALIVLPLFMDNASSDPRPSGDIVKPEGSKGM